MENSASYVFSPNVLCFQPLNTKKCAVNEDTECAIDTTRELFNPHLHLAYKAIKILYSPCMLKALDHKGVVTLGGRATRVTVKILRLSRRKLQRGPSHSKCQHESRKHSRHDKESSVTDVLTLPLRQADNEHSSIKVLKMKKGQTECKLYQTRW